MSRIAKKPIAVPAGVEVKISGQDVTVKGPKGTLTMQLHADVSLAQDGDVLSVTTEKADKPTVALAGTMNALVTNMVTGASVGYQKKLELVGVGYRAQAKGKELNLSLGFSHPVVFPVPEGIVIETPSQTEIVVSGVDKQAVGQVSAKIRAYRPPEPYKGKGIKYAGEHIVRKEAKKK